MHIVLSFSPVGDPFRERLCKFPSLVNCTTIDWFTQWPEDALQSVASKFLSSIKGMLFTTQLASLSIETEATAPCFNSLIFFHCDAGVEKSVLDQLPNICVVFHGSLHGLSARFLAEQRRHYYVTPTSYLELLLSYRTLLDSKQEEVMGAKKRYFISMFAELCTRILLLLSESHINH